ncbi:DinB family protein [Flavobacterium sp. PLA-1-15]|uniref:DinB family protein n=1 Tax=Flavobacterium sp. PLA-1-15 TaxID=3380533 RepID=UPI003B829890
MQYAFEVTQTSRKQLAYFLENYTLEQLNKVPEGFSNNLIWNIGHIIVVQQLLVYKLSGLSTMLSEEMIFKYQKGSRPEGFVDQKEVDELHHLLTATIDKTIADFESDSFKSYHFFKNNLGFTIGTAEEAVKFNNYHEAIHLGMMMSIRKFI